MNEIQNNQWIAHYRTDQPHFGLERMVELLALRGNPHLKLKVIHIGGTNGKGSTIAFLKKMLEKLGLRVGVFSSPYLIHYTDQISINGESIPEARLEALMADYQSLLEGESADNLQGTTEFEIITALAYDYFASEQVDVAIMEVGMGGLLDSTNVCQPILTGITTIGLDHVALLGDTLEAIAEQKAGIIKERVPLVTGKISSEALAVIHTIAQQHQASHVCYGKDYQVESVQRLAEGEKFRFSNAFRQKEGYQSALLGVHQVENAGLALELCDQYCYLKGLPLLSENEVRRALKQTYWPARLEKIINAPLILLDGAHNPHAMKALIASLESYFPDYQKHILFSCIQTKALDEMVALLKTVSKSQLFLTTFEDSRSFSTEEMQGLAKREKLAYVEWLPYLEQYKKVKHGEKELLLITGSLYFLANVRKYLISD